MMLRCPIYGPHPLDDCAERDQIIYDYEADPGYALTSATVEHPHVPPMISDGFLSRV